MANTFLLPTPRIEREIQSISWQKEASDEIIDKLTSSYKDHPRRGVVLRGGTGLGKMYIKAEVIADMLNRGLLTQPEGSFNPFPVLWLCPKSVKQQTHRVLKSYGIAHLVMLFSYGQLKNSDGTNTFLTYITNERGEIVVQWFDHMLPAILVCDECQVLKNPESLQSKTVRYCPPVVKRLFASATPVQRVSDGRTILEGCGVITKYNALPASITTSSSILRQIAYPKAPEKYSPAAVERFRREMEPYIVELKNVRFKFPTQTIQTVINFKTEQTRQEYLHAYEEYLREVAEGKRKGSCNHGYMAMLVALQKFKEKASLLRADEIADRAVAQIAKGKQIIVGADYISTLRSVWVHLVKRLNVDRNRITFVVGGQSEKLRQENIDKFQAGDADVMLITVKSGGVGISLHHDRPESRPRYVIVPPTWSAIDLVQYLGRAHRLTSISATIQEVLWYDGTVESEKVMPYVKNKMKCLSKAVTAKEQFIHMFERNAEEEANDFYDGVAETIQETTESTVENVDEHSEEVTGEGLEGTEDLPTTYR